jgi:hypothetical protein
MTVRVHLGGGNYADLEPDRFGEVDRSLLEDGPTAKPTEEKRRRLIAELQILEWYDQLRQHAGHDFGSGQRWKELARRRRELGDVWSFDMNSSPVELEEAFERVGRPRLRRLERDIERFVPAGYVANTPTARSIETWRKVERHFVRRRA